MRRPEPLDIFQPNSVEEASSILREKGPGGNFLAGGTDLIIAIKEKGLVPKYIVDLKRIPALSGIREEPTGGLAIGALTTLREVETSPILRQRYPFLAQSAAEVGSIQIRNRATIGGNMANATPSADVAPSLLALKANAKISGKAGERVVELEKFFRGPGQTVMGPDEILTELLIPPSQLEIVGEYIKFSPREMMDLAYIGVAVALLLSKKERRCEEVRIALGAVSPTPMRARKAERLREVETSPILRQRYPFLAQSAAEVGSIQIRNRATIGGNMANATPSADVAPSLLALKANAKISGKAGERVVELEKFFRGPGQTVMGPDEILTELLIPPSQLEIVGEYIKFSPREMMDLAYIGVAVALLLSKKERRCEEVRIALGAVSPTPMRARKAESVLSKQILTEELAERAGEEASRECKPISDVRSSAEYRREMVRVNTKRALLNAAANQNGATPWNRRRDRRY